MKSKTETLKPAAAAKLAPDVLHQIRHWFRFYNDEKRILPEVVNDLLREALEARFDGEAK